MSRIDQGAALAAQSQILDLLGQRTGRTPNTHPAVQSVLAYWTNLEASQPPKQSLRDKLTREAEDLEVAIAELASKLGRRRTQIAELNRYPDEDPYTDDTVLRFKKAFKSDPDKLYTYTASRYEGLWYVTGDRSPNAVAWADLVSWMGLGVTEVYKIAPGRAAKVAWSEPATR